MCLECQINKTYTVLFSQHVYTTRTGVPLIPPGTGNYTAVRTLDESGKRPPIFVVNRSQTEALETTVWLDSGHFVSQVHVHVVTGPDPKATNTAPSWTRNDNTDRRKEPV